MDVQDQPRAAVTLMEDREVPEEEVLRTPEMTRSFQVRSAETVTQGTRRRRGAQAGTPAPPEAPAAPGRSFEVKEAVTVTLRPPHWEGLTEAAPAATSGQEIQPGGIPSGEAFGIPTITQGPPPGAEKEDK